MKKVSKKSVLGKKKTNYKIVATALVALGFIELALFTHWLFILPALFLWWVNKKAIKRHFSS